MTRTARCIAAGMLFLFFPPPLLCVTSYCFLQGINVALLSSYSKKDERTGCGIICSSLAQSHHWHFGPKSKLCLVRASELGDEFYEGSAAGAASAYSDLVWKKKGEIIILDAISAVSDDISYKVTWQPSKLTITIDNDSLEDLALHGDFSPNNENDDLGDELDYDDECIDDEERDRDDPLSVIARSVIGALHDDDLDQSLRHIAETHEIIVTTPGASDVLTKQREFDAFVGFDVLVKTRQLPPPVALPEGDVETKTAKKKKKAKKFPKELSGKLVGRNEENVQINVKGKVTKVPLEVVEEVRLPPAKREKGVR